jgi:hypothetical protein
MDAAAVPPWMLQCPCPACLGRERSSYYVRQHMRDHMRGVRPAPVFACPAACRVCVPGARDKSIHTIVRHHQQTYGMEPAPAPAAALPAHPEEPSLLYLTARDDDEGGSSDEGEHSSSDEGDEGESSSSGDEGESSADTSGSDEEQAADAMGAETAAMHDAVRSLAEQFGEQLAHSRSSMEGQTATLKILHSTLFPFLPPLLQRLIPTDARSLPKVREER